MDRSNAQPSSGEGATLEELEFRFGPARAAKLAWTQAMALVTQDSDQAFRLIQASEPIRRRAGEDVLIEGWLVELRMLHDAYAPGDVTEVGDAPLAQQADTLLARADAEQWSMERRAAVLIQLAWKGVGRHQERAALRLLDHARWFASGLVDAHADCVASLRAALLNELAERAVESGEGATAGEAFGAVIDLQLALGCENSAFQTLNAAAAAIVARNDAAGSMALAVALAPHACRLEARMGARATDILQGAYRQALISLTSAQTDAETVLTLHQLAKGLRFATALTGGAAVRGDEDRVGAELLAAIAKVERSLPPEALVGPPQDLREQTRQHVILGAYADRKGRTGAPAEERTTPEARLKELQVRYDAHLSEAMLAGRISSEPTLPLADVLAAIDEETLLVSLFIGYAPTAGDGAVWGIGLTRQGAQLTLQPLGTSWLGGIEVGIGGEGFDLSMDIVGFQVAIARMGIEEAPLGRRHVSRVAEESLEQLCGYLLGMIGERLDDYRAAGKRHLCIAPHRSLHYLPFHLLTRGGRPLGEEWTVTYLPNLRVLTGPGGSVPRVPPRPRALAAIACGFAGGGPLRPLPGAVPEAEEIAALFGETALTDGAATEAAVQEALQSARMIHIATHGSSNVSAPAFHALHLAPSEGSDGRLCAYELQGLDLHGAELVTLSACQTALGRFDTGDNLRGLPAALLLAGVATVIGTLWPVRDDVARAFFVTLYSAIVRGAGRLAAYRVAIDAIRARYPQYRHWGCFYYAGQWETQGG